MTTSGLWLWNFEMRSIGKSNMAYGDSLLMLDIGKRKETQSCLLSACAHTSIHPITSYILAVAVNLMGWTVNSELETRISAAINICVIFPEDDITLMIRVIIINNSLLFAFRENIQLFSYTNRVNSVSMMKSNLNGKWVDLMTLQQISLFTFCFLHIRILCQCS